MGAVKMVGLGAAGVGAAAAVYYHPLASFAGLLGISSAVLLAAKLSLEAVHRSVGLAGPSQRQLAEEDHSQHALFRHLPGAYECEC